MELRDALRMAFGSLAAAGAAYFLGFGNEAVFLFALSVLGAAFVEKVDSVPYAFAAVFAAVALASYIYKRLLFTNPAFAIPLLFVFLPFLLMEARKLGLFAAPAR